MTRNRLIDVLCFIVSPAILGGIFADKFFPDQPRPTFFVLAIALLMYGIIRKAWKKEDNSN